MDKILFKLLLLDGNETSMIKGIETYKDFRSLTIEVAKASKNVRYCKNHHCSCHPESVIKILLKNKDLKDFLNNYAKGIVEDLEFLCEEYSPDIAKGIFEE